MEYDRQDYEALFGDHYQPKPWTIGRLMLFVICLGLILASWGVAGCTDSQDAFNTAQVEQEAHEKKLALLSMPCTWIAQCSHEPCPIPARKCVDADLSARTK